MEKEQQPHPPRLHELAYHKGSERAVKFILREIFAEETYFRHGLTLEPGATIIDAGANIGLFALYCDRVCRGECRIVCFEPIPETAALLRRNIAQLASGSRIDVVEAGLTSNEGRSEADFMYIPGNPGGSTYKADEKADRVIDRAQRWFQHRGPLLRWLQGPWLRHKRHFFDNNPRIRCPLTTLSRACIEYDIERVDLLKIDVEDAEIDVLKGIDAATWPRIHQLVVEVHLAERVGQLEEQLRGLGFASVHADSVGWADDTFTLYARR